MRTIAVAGTLLPLCFFLAACGGPGASSAEGDPGGALLGSGLAALAAETDNVPAGEPGMSIDAAAIERSAALLQEVLESGDALPRAPRVAEVDGTLPTGLAALAPEVASVASPPQAEDTAADDHDRPTEGWNAGSRRELASMLVDRALDRDPPDIAPLIAASLLHERALEDAHGRLSLLLTEEQAAAVRTLARTLRGMLADEAGSLSMLDRETLLAHAEGLTAEWREGLGVRLGTVELCRRVEGYGRYAELGQRAFLAGSPARALVYAELDRFATREAPADEYADGGSGGREVRVTIELLLYHDADGLLAWRQPAQETRYVSLRRTRDFFLVSRVELPRTLTVGEYRLKVVVRDLITESVDERTLPVRVVADPALTLGAAG